MKKIVKKYREQTVGELNKEAIMLREEVARLQLVNKTTPAKDTNLLKKKRKQLAMLLTVLTEKIELEKISAKK